METTSRSDLRASGDALLRRLVGREDATFRPSQWEAIEALVGHRRRVLVVQRTGWGKSAVYVVATALLRAAGAGPTIIVSPLLALMRDQVAAAGRAGVRAVTINSANAEDWGTVSQQLRADLVDLLLISPERLNNPRFRDEHLGELAQRAGLLVVDEAHCVSDWGHDFRPDYRRIADLLAGLPAGSPVLATTATANERVVRDVVQQLGGAEVTVLRGPLARDSLRLGVLRLPSATERLAWLVAHLDALPGSGIIYALTVSAAEDVAAALAATGHQVRAYTGRTDPAERPDLEQALRHNDIKALVATSALGMGFDKPDLGFVVHLGSPGSPIGYYQQVGRAGRATDRADVLLLPGPEDAEIWAWMATASMPQQEQAEAVIRALQASSGPLSTGALETVTNLRRTRLELLLKVLDVDGAVRRVSGGWTATGRPWVYDAERYAALAAARRAEQQAMLDYETTRGCRMAFLQVQLDDPTAAACGRCDRCAGPWFPTEVPAAARDVADAQLRRVGVPIEPRVQWPAGMERLGIPVRGRIPAGEQVQAGRAVGRLTDLGWGQRLRALLEAAEPTVDDQLLAACAAVLRDWDWAQRPTAVVAVPSRHRPALAAAVAEGLARLGRLPYLGSLDIADADAGGGPGGNSAFRLADVWDRLTVPAGMSGRLSEGPVLLVDDLVDSRWTVTVAGRALRLAGAPAVLPFALAAA